MTDDVFQGYTQPLSTADFVEGLIAMIRSRHSGSLAYKLSEITHPSLILWGAEDRWIPVSHARMFYGLLPNSRLEIIDEVGHVPHEEKWEQVNDIVMGFLSDQSLPQME